MAMQRLREAAEKAKIELSSSLQVCNFSESLCKETSSTTKQLTINEWYNFDSTENTWLLCDSLFVEEFEKWLHWLGGILLATPALLKNKKKIIQFI